jgi:hypothetical protein
VSNRRGGSSPVSATLFDSLSARLLCRRIGSGGLFLEKERDFGFVERAEPESDAEVLGEGHSAGRVALRYKRVRPDRTGASAAITMITSRALPQTLSPNNLN